MAPPTSGASRPTSFIKIIWALAWALQLLHWAHEDNHLKCLCSSDELLLSRERELLFAGLSGDTNKLVIRDNKNPQLVEASKQRQQDNRQSATNSDEQEARARANDLRAAHLESRVAADRANVTISIIDNQELARAPASRRRTQTSERQTNPLIELEAAQTTSTAAATAAAAASHYELIGGDRAPPFELGDASFLFHHRPAPPSGAMCGATLHDCHESAPPPPPPTTTTTQDDERGARATRGPWQHFCASDGQLYASVCEMRRRACELNINLHRMSSLAHCRQRQRRLKWAPLEHTSDNLPTRPEAGAKLKSRACSRNDYEQFKEALWREFNANIELMFEYLDINRDRAIEARELWPRGRHLELANANWCAVGWNSAAAAGCSNEPAEFPFEPHYAWSGCSLSHLMVFELQREGDKLEPSSLARAFARFGSRHHERPPPETARNAIKSTRQSDTTQVHLKLGEFKLLACLSGQLEAELRRESGGSQNQNQSRGDELGLNCIWSRHGTNLASLRDEHVQLLASEISETKRSGAVGKVLRLIDAQLYLSGHYECACHLGERKSFVHNYQIQVTAKPHVSIKPRFQWSLASSRVSFECQYDFIDTSQRATTGASQGEPQIEWLKVESGSRETLLAGGRSQLALAPKLESGLSLEAGERARDTGNSSARASISMASSRLVLENLQLNDTGDYKCRLEVPLQADGERLSGATTGRLLVQDQMGSSASAAAAEVHHLWRFHEAGISIYKLNEDEGQELELVRELSGHDEIRGELDGNWNQLTLCGGLNPKQAVICEWSDNAIELSVGTSDQKDDQEDSSHERRQARWPTSWPARQDSSSSSSSRLDQDELAAKTSTRRYIYIGQPNLNRLLVLDGRELTIVAVVNTEPQPRKLFAFKPNKIHLNKWVRRRLSPIGNARWLQAIEFAAHQRAAAHPLELTPESALASSHSDDERQVEQEARVKRQTAALFVSGGGGGGLRNQQRAPKLVQHDIWLLCYGQPLVVDPASESSGEPDDSDQAEGPLEASQRGANNRTGVGSNGPSVSTWPLYPTHFWHSGEAKEARLRNRKSIQVIQSTFFARPQWRRRSSGVHMHATNSEEPAEQEPGGAGDELAARRDWPPAAGEDRGQSGALRAVNEFKRLGVLTTHYVMSGPRLRGADMTPGERLEPSPSPSPSLFKRRSVDLVQELAVPSRPQWLTDDAHFKLHYAYALHYGEQQLYRIAMDSYHYDRQIDLADCDPTGLLASPQGQLIVQCRAPITHKPTGQLVLDELTGAKLQFNGNICAQDSYLSPDARYLVSVDTNQTNCNQSQAARKRANTVIYVQSVRADGLALDYEIKTALEIVQCSFVWKDGYYAALFVALNRRDQQSELLSLRLADGRLELMVRVPGLVRTRARRRQPLNILHELKVASLSTSEGTHILDLDENRIIQTLRQHHQSSPTLLWA